MTNAWKMLTVGVTGLTMGLATLLGVFSPTLEPCQTEDQETSCYWDAQTSGDGYGDDFVVTEVGVVHVELTGKDRVTVYGHVYKLAR